MNLSYLIEWMVKLSQWWHVSPLELDWYRAERDLVGMLIEILQKYAEEFKPMESHPSDAGFIWRPT
jgi:hypothetical protein